MPYTLQPGALLATRQVKASLEECQSVSGGLDLGREFNRRSNFVRPCNAQQRLHTGDPTGLQIDLRLEAKDCVAGCEASL